MRKHRLSEAWRRITARCAAGGDVAPNVQKNQEHPVPSSLWPCAAAAAAQQVPVRVKLNFFSGLQHCDA